MDPKVSFTLRDYDCESEREVFHLRLLDLRFTKKSFINGVAFATAIVHCELCLKAHSHSGSGGKSENIL